MGLDTATVNKTILNEKLRKGVFQGFWFNSMLGEATYNKKVNNWALSGSIVERFTDFKKTGRNSMLVTMLKNIYGEPIYGKGTITGHEKDFSFNYAKLYVHLLKQAVNLPDDTDEEKLHWMDLAAQAIPALTRWGAGWMNSEAVRALLEGYSAGITASTDNNGLGIEKKYHKNFWIWDGTNKSFTSDSHQPVFSYDTDSYKASIIDKIKNGGALDSSDTFIVDTLYESKAMASYSNVEPFYYKGKPYRILVISSRQEATLKASEGFSNAVAQGMPRGLDNPLFTGGVYVFGDFIIFVDDVITRFAYANDSGSGILDFFNYSGGVEQTESGLTEGMYEKVQLPGTGQHANCALLLGASSLALSEYKDWWFAPDSVDYDSVRGLAIKKYFGLQRLDFLDNESPSSATNEDAPQSAIIVTYQ